MSRPSNDFMDRQIDFGKYEVLDHGFVRVVDYMGDDAAIVQAARVSSGTGVKTFREDSGLINYLMKNDHTSPFEMCEVKLHCKMPIFVARQWIRHRTANVNEYSGRYSEMSPDFYIPKSKQVALQSTSNMQGRELEPIEVAEADEWRQAMAQGCEANYAFYRKMLDRGISRELARLSLPVNFYTEWYWKIDLHNLLHWLFLRNDAHAQWEIHEYGLVVDQLIEGWTPMTYAAFRKRSAAMKESWSGQK